MIKNELTEEEIFAKLTTKNNIARKKLNNEKITTEEEFIFQERINPITNNDEYIDPEELINSRKYQDGVLRSILRIEKLRRKKLIERTIATGIALIIGATSYISMDNDKDTISIKELLENSKQKINHEKIINLKPQSISSPKIK